jgi:WhiB family redox-sensing transcriptional regulator
MVDLSSFLPELGLAGVPVPGSWVREARCRGVSPAVFFVGRGDSVDQARAICKRCPVRIECLEYALAWPQLLGVWAGTTVAQREEARERSRATQELAPAPMRESAPRGTLYRLLEELSAHPGRWARVAHYASAHSSQAVASLLRNGRRPQPVGVWEFEGRRCLTGGSGLYARRLDAGDELREAAG